MLTIGRIRDTLGYRARVKERFIRMYRYRQSRQEDFSRLPASLQLVRSDVSNVEMLRDAGEARSHRLRGESASDPRTGHRDAA